MSNEDQPGPRRQQPPRRARTLIVRWWHDAEGDGGLIRGVLRDIDGASLGAFNDFSDLLALLRREAQRDD